MKFTSARFLQPVILGSVSNILVNYIFNPSDPDFILEEFIAAIALSIPLTETNHFIDLRLENKYGWINSFRKRLSVHLFLLLGVTIFGINLFGNIFIYIKGDSFYSLHETIIINAIAFFVAVLLTGLSWMAFYFNRWKETELDLVESNRRLSDVQKSIRESDKPIPLSKGSKKIVVATKEIDAAYILHGIVRVETKANGSTTYHGTLLELGQILPPSLFFIANRSIILHRDLVHTFNSSTYGKINVELKTNIDSLKSVTVSRKKASAFRKWFNSVSS